MIELSIHQEKLLTRLATGKTKYYATVMSIAADGAASQRIDEMFAEDMRLVEWGLLYDVTSKPKFKETVANILKEDGRSMRVLAPTEMAEMMFGPRPGSVH